MAADDGLHPPALRVVRGDPTAQETAAVVAVVAMLSARAEATRGLSRRPRPAWNDPARAVRRPVHAGPDGWRAATRPPP
jgi:hypothetical protein